MREAARRFLGRKSFHNFSKTSPGKDPFRTLTGLAIEKKGDFLVLTITGESFLWQMVRRIATALLKVGRGELAPSEIEEFFDPAVKRKFPPAPAEGLVLWEVRYPFEFKNESYSAEKLAGILLKQKEKFLTRAQVCQEILKELE